MKKFLTIALAGVLAASMLFTGCSKKEESKETARRFRYCHDQRNRKTYGQKG